MSIGWFNRQIEKYTAWDEDHGLGGWLLSNGHRCDTCGAWVWSGKYGNPDECTDCEYARIREESRKFWESAKIVTTTGVKMMAKGGGSS